MARSTTHGQRHYLPNALSPEFIIKVIGFLSLPGQQVSDFFFGPGPEGTEAYKPGFRFAALIVFSITPGTDQRRIRIGDTPDFLKKPDIVPQNHSLRFSAVHT